ncbi:c-type cytochrome [Beggiatoa alba]|nr:c-type cytochrome [Beggiatoa alba]
MHQRIFPTSLFFTLLFIFSGLTNFAQANELSQGAMLSNTCAACHGPDGNSSSEIPSIGSLSATYIETSLKAFRSGMRASTVMGRHAKGYSDAEIKLIADYFSKKRGAR